MTTATATRDKPFSIPQAFDEAFVLLDRRAMALAGVSIVLVMMSVLDSHVVDGTAGLISAGVLMGLAILSSAAFMVQLIANQKGEALPVMAVWSKAVDVSLYFMITALAVFCLKQVGLVLLIVPGIMISAVFFLAPQLAVREGCSPYQALRRALVLSCGYRLAFGTVVAMFFGAEMMLVLISRGLLSAWYETATTTTLTIVLMGVLIAIKAAVAVAAFAQLRE